VVARIVISLGVPRLYLARDRERQLCGLLPPRGRKAGPQFYRRCPEPQGTNPRGVIRSEARDLGQVGAQDREHRSPIGTERHSEEMLEARRVLGRVRELRRPRIGQGPNKEESVEQAVQQFSALRGQYRPAALQQLHRVGRKNQSFQEKIAQKRRRLLLVLQCLDCPAPLFGSVVRLFEQALGEQPDGPMPLWQFCSLAAARRR
jgi:hypothetical protein